MVRFTPLCFPKITSMSFRGKISINDQFVFGDDDDKTPYVVTQLIAQPPLGKITVTLIHKNVVKNEAFIKQPKKTKQ